MQQLTIRAVGAPNYQRFAETWMALIAARDGNEIAPGSVKVELKPKGGEINVECGRIHG